MMNDLLKWNKSMPLCIKYPVDPLLSIQDAIDNAMDDFYSYFEVINKSRHYCAEKNMPPIGSEGLRISIKVVVKALDEKDS